MAGTSDGFDKSAFEAGIRTAMGLGAPVAVADQAKFYFPKVTTSAADANGVPFALNATPTVTQKPAQVVACAIETVEVADQDTRLGTVRPSRLKVTLLEAEHTTVKGCAYVVVGGDRFDYRHTDPPVGLYDASVWTMWFTRSDV